MAACESVPRWLRAALVVALGAALAGCAVVPLKTAHVACTTIDIALVEADMAPAWYLDAGKVLEACGVARARDRAESAACEAERRNGHVQECGGAE